MNEDLKIDVYQRVVNGVDFSEKEAVKKSACVLYAKKFSNRMKEIHFYSSDFMGNGEDLFQMGYNIECTNGDFQNGNCMIDTKEAIAVFGFANYDELKSYLGNKYNGEPTPTFSALASRSYYFYSDIYYGASVVTAFFAYPSKERHFKKAVK